MPNQSTAPKLVHEKPPRSFQTLSAVALLALALAGCGSDAPGPGGPGGPGAGMPPPEVDVMLAGTGGATLTQDLPGRLQAVRTAQVRARVEGVVEKRLFTEGSDVKAATPLYQIDARTYKAAAESARADLSVARVTVERYKPLLDVKAVSQQEYDAAAAKTKQAEAALAKAELDLENANVLAPISGRIGRALVTEGALVGKGDATQLAVIEQLDPIYANFTQSGAELLRLKAAIQAGKMRATGETSVEMLLEDGSSYPQKGRLTFSDLAMDPNTGAVTLRAEFPNPRRDLLPGMFVRIRFPQATMDKVIRIPQKAVQMGPLGAFVLIVGDDGKVVNRPIKTSGMSGSDWIVSDGLKVGEQVVVNGLQKARPGSAVKPVALGAAPAGAAPNPAGAAPTPAPAPASDKKAG
jgi:membrane fusion protein (multidrug efflux system)